MTPACAEAPEEALDRELAALAARLRAEPDLAELVAAWGKLAEPVQVAILHLARASAARR